MKEDEFFIQDIVIGKKEQFYNFLSKKTQEKEKNYQIQAKLN